MNRPTGLGPDSILGIDLGTTNTLLSWYDGECSRILAPEGSGGDTQALLPSVVAILEDGTELIGEAAKAMALQHPTRVIHSVKRLIGRSLTEIRVEAERLPYEVVEGAGGQVRIRIRLDGKDGRPAFKDYSPEEISALVLREVHARAFEAMGVPSEERPRRIVLTVPAYFDDAQRQASKNAAKIAGLEVLRLVNEPTAASLAYGLGKDKEGRILVYDLGGGTFDVSILRVSDGVFRVLSTHGDTQLGGDDIDRVLLDYLLTKIEECTGASLASNPMVLSTLRRSAEGLKKRLSEAEEAELRIDHGGAEDLVIQLTRSELETMIAPLIERTTRSLRSALQDAELDPAQIDDVVLVGGSTRIPLVRAQLDAYFDKPPHCELDPDLAIAMGAATQASVLAGAQDDLLLMDVVPLSLGIETLGGAFSKLILRNSTVPCSQTEEFTTRVDKQTGIELNVYQGERELITDCRKIGHLKLSGIPAMKAGLPRVAVTFSVDADGILRVSARELRSGQTASAEIQATLGLGEAQVQAIVMESIEKAGEDFEAREALELKNKARALIQGTEQVLASGGDEALAPEQSYAVHKALKKLKKLADGDDVQALHAAVDRLGSLTMQLADEMIGASVRKALSTSNATSTATPEASAETSGDQA